MFIEIDYWPVLTMTHMCLTGIIYKFLASMNETIQRLATENMLIIKLLCQLFGIFNRFSSSVIGGRNSWYTQSPIRIRIPLPYFDREFQRLYSTYDRQVALLVLVIDLLILIGLINAEPKFRRRKFIQRDWLRFFIPWINCSPVLFIGLNNQRGGDDGVFFYVIKYVRQ